MCKCCSKSVYYITYINPHVISFVIDHVFDKLLILCTRTLTATCRILKSHTELPAPFAICLPVSQHASQIHNASIFNMLVR